jgi:hypothetical protein
LAAGEEPATILPDSILADEVRLDLSIAARAEPDSMMLVHRSARG